MPASDQYPVFGNNHDDHVVDTLLHSGDHVSDLDDASAIAFAKIKPKSHTHDDGPVVITGAESAEQANRKVQDDSGRIEALRSRIAGQHELEVQSMQEGLAAIDNHPQPYDFLKGKATIHTITPAEIPAVEQTRDEQEPRALTNA